MFRRRVVDDAPLAEDRAVEENRVAARRTVVERPPWSPAQLVALIIGVISTVIGVMLRGIYPVAVPRVNFAEGPAPLLTPPPPVSLERGQSADGG